MRSCNAVRFTYWFQSGFTNSRFLRIIIEQNLTPVVVDAGIGAPSHALEALELGGIAVLRQYRHSRS